MLKVFTTRQMEVMRREAKLRAREGGIQLAKALDQIAAEHGFKNWSLLQKNSEIQPQPWLFRRSREEMALSLRMVPEPHRHDRRSRSDVARDMVQPIDARFISAANAVDFASDYVASVLALPRFHLKTQSTAYWEMRLWLPYGAHEVEGSQYILVNRYYKPVGSISKERVDYTTYPHLILNLRGDEWRGFSHSKAENPFLFSDGSTPWRDRQCAEAYLARLKKLRELL